MKRKTIITIPPHAPFVDEVLDHEVVSGVRLNTVMPVKGARKRRLGDLDVGVLEERLSELKENAGKRGKDFYVDLKARQLRVRDLGEPPFTEIELSHEIDVFTPTKAYFHDRNECATILEVDGRNLIMQEGPRRVVGPGESVTIPNPTLSVKGFLTEDDLAYIEASKKTGIHDYMLSFVEGERDIEALRAYDPEARVVAKIESIGGLKYVKDEWDDGGKLMAARGDLYMELKWPHKITEAVEMILSRDPEAIVASRILSSMSNSPEPSCSDVGDLDNLLRMGYRTLMLGDEICMERKSVISALNVIGSVAERYDCARCGV